MNKGLKKNKNTVAFNWAAFDKLLTMRGWTEKHVSNLAGRSQPYFSHQRHTSGRVNLLTVYKLASIFGVQPQDLIASDRTDPVPTEPLVAPSSVSDNVMRIEFSDLEYTRIEILTKVYDLERTTDLFHMMLREAYRKYYRQKVTNDYNKKSREELVAELVAMKTVALMKEEKENTNSKEVAND